MTPYELAQRIGFLLSQKKLKLAIVESCTGGSLAKLVTDVPGASEWFDCGFITYSNESKIRFRQCAGRIDCPKRRGQPESCTGYGKGRSRRYKRRHRHFYHGNCRPDGGSLEKPVGTVCFGFATKESYFSTDKQLFDGDRSKIREKSVIYSLECLCNYLETGHF